MLSIITIHRIIVAVTSIAIFAAVIRTIMIIRITTTGHFTPQPLILRDSFVTLLAHSLQLLAHPLQLLARV